MTFILVTWNQRDIVAGVDEVFHDDASVLLNFMVHERRSYVWPSASDTSYENVYILKTRVNLELVPQMSMQR